MSKYISYIEKNDDDSQLNIIAVENIILKMIGNINKISPIQVFDIQLNAHVLNFFKMPDSL
jgi:hypothetical protein